MHSPVQYDFCRHCVRDLEECRWCGDAVGVCPKIIDEGDVCRFKACHDPDKPCYAKEWDNIGWAGGEYDRWLEDHPEHAASDDDAEGDYSVDDGTDEWVRCVACDEDVAAAETVMWRGDGLDYCVDCFKAY